MAETDVSVANDRASSSLLCLSCRHGRGWHVTAVKARRRTPKGWRMVETGYAFSACGKPGCGCKGWRQEEPVQLRLAVQQWLPGL